MTLRTIIYGLGGMVAAAGLAGAAIAQDSPMQGAFGNTIMSTDGAGAVTKSYLEPDGTYRVLTPDGSILTGRWSVERNRLCYRGDAAPGAPPLCTMGPGKKVGDKWSIFAEGGSKVRVEIVAGR